MTQPDVQPRRRWGRVGLLGPAFVAAVAYVDPGNVAANIAGGARFGFLLLWVLVVASASAALVQYLSAKLGIAAGASLPELMRDRLRPRARIAYWLQAEAVAMATDLAEVIGGAIALQLLFGLPLLAGGVVAGAVSMALLAFQSHRRQATFERIVTGLLLVITIGFVAGLFIAPPPPAEVLRGLIPRFDGSDSILLASAMFGATVMPHVVYLHSALTRDRFGRTAPGPRRRRLLTATRWDIGLSMTLAGSVNIAMLLLAATALPGLDGVDTIEGAQHAITANLGQGVGILFAVGLLVSGFASTSIGCYAGDVIMRGLTPWTMRLTVRRAITLAPALVALGLAANPTALLVLSQVVLSFGLPFVLIPLVRLTSDRALLGPAANSRTVTVVAWTVTAAVIAMNAVLIVSLALGG